MYEAPKLKDVLNDQQQVALENAWAKVRDAKYCGPVPEGVYVARVVGAWLFKSPNGTPGYRVSLEIIDGEHAGRKLWHELWLTDAALAATKHDLKRLGIASLEQLEQPCPAKGFVVQIRVKIDRRSDGYIWNRVTTFDVLRKDHLSATTAERFALDDDLQPYDGDDAGAPEDRS